MKRKGSRKRIKLTKSMYIMNWLNNAFYFGESITVEL